MTHKELHNLPWKLAWHCSGEICVSVYHARIGFAEIVREQHTIRKDDFTYGRTTVKYRFNGKIYRSHKSVLEAINEYLHKIKR